VTLVTKQHLRVQLKRAYAPPSPEDGVRVLVDRVWPRGLRKSEAAIDRWVKDVAPSAELCRVCLDGRADHVGGALLTARATGHCHLPRSKISTEALRHAAYSRSLDNGIPVSQTRSCRL
jgi:hypothetical protein